MQTFSEFKANISNGVFFPQESEYFIHHEDTTENCLVLVNDWYLWNNKAAYGFFHHAVNLYNTDPEILFPHGNYKAKLRRKKAKAKIDTSLILIIAQAVLSPHYQW